MYLGDGLPAEASKHCIMEVILKPVLRYQKTIVTQQDLWVALWLMSHKKIFHLLKKWVQQRKRGEKYPQDFKSPNEKVLNAWGGAFI
jgi:hypothetical protein